MAWAEYGDGQWSAPQAVPQQARQIHPGAMALQFGASVFEGCKAHLVSAGAAHAFRLREHHARLIDSCERLCIPCPPYEMFAEAVRLILSQASSWQAPFASDWLYVRPVVIALDDHIMPVVAARYAFYVMTAPIRPFLPPSFNLWVEQRYSRAAPGGLGAAKTGANYAHQLFPSAQARKAGCDAVLWLDPYDRRTIEEGSTMNLFFRAGDEVLTPALKDTILPGITRRSVIAILKNEGWRVTERPITINEVSDWIHGGRLDEAFATSTALGVRAVDTLTFDGEKYRSARNPELSQRLSQTLQDVYRGQPGAYGEWAVPIAVGEG